MRNFWAVLAASLGSVLFAIPSWIRAVLPLSWQHWMDSKLAFDVNTVRRAYWILIPLGLFSATYKAWKEENDARIAAEKLSPQELQDEVRQLAKQLEETKADLASQRRRRLLPAQRELLLAACKAAQKESAEALRFGVYFNSWNDEARDYAVQLCEIFSAVGMSGVPGGTTDVPRELEGVIIRFKPGALPNNAKRLSDLLKKGLISDRWEALTGPRAALVKDDYLDLAIGRSSAPQDVIDWELRKLHEQS